MLYFVNDYSQGAHERILQRLMQTNREPLSPYGTDVYTESAKQKIRAACACDDAQIWLLVGGTQTNQVVIDATLSACEGVIAAATGHIASHEAGAIEMTGHKVLTLPHNNGKLDARTVRDWLRRFYADENREHMVSPGMVYISHPTEYGTLYSKEELAALREVCDEYRLPLYLDGARLGYALACDDCDVSLPDIAALCDIFYIGGTKLGALCGEAVVFSRRKAPPRFMSIIKQHGALLAKGRLLGIQFDTLFTDDLYLENGRHALRMASRLRDAFAQKGYRFYIDSPTNQLFVILSDRQRARLEEFVAFSFWERTENGDTVVRFATGWATSPADVDALIARL